MSLIIDGTTYNVPIVELNRTADVLDKYAERSVDGVLHREIIGVYFNYKVKLGSTAPASEYAALWNKITEPVPFHTVTLPDEDGDTTFECYFSGVGDDNSKSKGALRFWKNLSFSIIARSPARTA